MTIRSKHNDLLNYFVHDHQDLSPAYVRNCEKFFRELGKKRNDLNPVDISSLAPMQQDIIYLQRLKREASSSKPQAPSTTKKPQLNNRINK